MPKTQASWISGTSVQTRRQGYFITQARDGFGSVFHTHGKEWFFFPVPTPVIVDGQRANLVKFCVLYRTIGTTFIEAIHLDEGRKKLKVLNTNAYGDHDDGIDPQNSWVVQPSIAMNYGLNIGLLVNFGPPTKLTVPGIEFVAAGADFETP